MTISLTGMIVLYVRMFCTASLCNIQGQNICDRACGQKWIVRELA
jgi:hypothetical protein